MAKIRFKSTLKHLKHFTIWIITYIWGQPTFLFGKCFPFMLADNRWIMWSLHLERWHNSGCQFYEGGWFQILVKKICNYMEWTQWQNVITGASFHKNIAHLQLEIWCAVAGFSSTGFCIHFSNTCVSKETFLCVSRASCLWLERWVWR